MSMRYIHVYTYLVYVFDIYLIYVYGIYMYTYLVYVFSMLKEHIANNYIIKECLTMCICDDKYFKVINMTTGHIKLYKRAVSIANRFSCSRDFVFNCLRSDVVCIHRGGVKFNIEVNRHPECVRARKDIIQKYSVRLGRIPDRLRHLLPENRR